MDITYKLYGKEIAIPLSQYVTASLTTERYGATETAQANADSAQEAIGRLCNILAFRGIVSELDVQAIADSDYPITFIRD
jgi:hypothetical protein